jgi:hypothetical protein
MAGEIAMRRGEHKVAPEHGRQSIRLHDQLGFNSEWLAHGAMLVGICSVLLGDPKTALKAADHYSSAFDPGLGTDDEIRALAYLKLGDLEHARTAIKRHAHEGATGKLVQQAASSLVLLAVLADAEGDASVARDIILNMGMCRDAEIWAYARHLAEELGVGTEFEVAQAPLLTDDGDAIQEKDAADIETLRRELTRRGW